MQETHCIQILFANTNNKPKEKRETAIQISNMPSN